MADSFKDVFAPWNNPASRRRFRRWSVDLPVYLDVDDNPHYCLLYDISPRGARLRIVDGATPKVDADVVLDLEGYGRIPAVVRHSAAGVVGLMFLHDDSAQEHVARWLLESKPTRRQARHDCRIEASVRTGGQELSCLVTDISRLGAAIQVAEAGQLTTSSEVQLLLPGYRPIAASIRYVLGNTVGLMLIDGFHGELPVADSAGVPPTKKAGSRV